MAEDKATPEGQRHIENWLRLQEHVRRAELALSDARNNLRGGEDALTRWMLPDDIKPGEKICVWHGDSLIQVEAPPLVTSAHLDGENVPLQPRPIITVRLRGKHGLNLL